MKISKTLFGLVACFVLLLPLCAHAVAGVMVRMDEDFEGTQIFADQNWPVYTTPTSFVPTVATQAVKGINVAYMDGQTTQINGVNPAIINTGTATAERYFNGAKSLKLANGQMVKVDASQDPDASRLDCFQFAVGVKEGAAAGTQVGHFKLDFSTNSTTDQTTELSYQLNFKVNAADPTKIDVVSAKTGSTLASFAYGSGYWANITLMAQQACTTSTAASGKADSTYLWGAMDYLTHEYKGPVDSTANYTTITATLHSGITVYVNSATTQSAASEALGVNALDPSGAFGNGGQNKPSNTAENGWEIAAENGATLYVDDMYWGDCPAATGWNGSIGVNSYYAEAGTRLNKISDRSIEPRVAAAKTWFLY